MIINADDFGHSRPINAGVTAAFDRRLVSSATLMPNMPAFEEAAEFVLERRLHEHIGVHLVLTEGTPLTDTMRKCRRFCDSSGQFFVWRERRRTIRLGGHEKRLVADELRAQIRRCREHRLPLTHIDSHQHVHTEWAVGDIVIALAREFEIRYVRLARNCGSALGPFRRAYKAAYNARLRHANLAATRYFGHLADYLDLVHSNVARERRSDIEIAMHPGVDAAGALVDRLIQDRTFSDLIALVEGASCARSYTGRALP